MINYKIMANLSKSAESAVTEGMYKEYVALSCRFPGLVEQVTYEVATGNPTLNFTQSVCYIILRVNALTSPNR